MPSSRDERVSTAAARLSGALLRAHQRFSLGALLALHPDLHGADLARALDAEQARDRLYLSRAGERALASARWALDPDLDDAEQRSRLAQAAASERRYLAGHITQAGRRLRSEAQVARLRALGQSEGYWLGGDRPTSCAGCRAMGGLVWPIEVLQAMGPHNRHHGCQCEILTLSEAKARGVSLVRGRRPVAEVNPPGPVATSIPALQPTDSDVALEASIQEALAGARDLGPQACAALGLALREATVPRWHEEDHPRWPPGSPLGGRFRPKIAVPNVLRAGFAQLADAARAGDADGVEHGFGQMVKAARKLRDPGERRDALRTAHRVRAAVFNPAGANVPMGTHIDLGNDARRSVPLPMHEDGIYGPWSTRGTFLWEVGPGELGPHHDRLLHDLRRSRSLHIAEREGGGVRIETQPGLADSDANARARQLELVLPHMRAMRASSPGVDLADMRPLDIDPEEGALPRRRSAYPLVSSEQLGQAGESTLDAVATRMVELGMLDDASDVDYLAGADKQSPLDWRLGDRAVEVKTVGMRSVIPGVAQRAPGIEESEIADKIAFAQANELLPALATVYADLDQDRAHVFLHDYTPGEPEFSGVRPPVDLIDRLLNGDLRPGDAATSQHGPRSGYGVRRHVFIGSFRLGYNPLARAGAPMDPEAARARARPTDVGPSGPVGPPEDPDAIGALPRIGDVHRLDRADRDAEIERLAKAGLSQTDIAAIVGLTQARVSQILKSRGVGPAPKKQRRSGPTRAALEREARAHASGGLNLRQIAKKMNLTQERVRALLGDEAPRAQGPRKRKRAPWAPWRRS